MNIISARLLNQQLCAPQFKEPAQVVAHFGAMQAQEYRLMRWAVAMRTKKPSAKAFEKAFNDGSIVRLHLNRGTWQLVSKEDYWWMLDLCSPKAEKTIRGWMSANHISLSRSEIDRVQPVLIQTTLEKGSATKEDYSEALERHGMGMDDHRVSYHIRMAELGGVLCSGDLLPMKATYGLSERKVGPRSTMDREAALALLARKYFQSHSPATLEDYVWWSGLNVSDCRKGMYYLGDELIMEKRQGREFYIIASCRTRGFKKGGTIFLPSYDEYLIGYKSRDISLPEEFRARAHNNTGVFFPVVLKDGIVCGNWSPFSNPVQYTLFNPDSTQINMSRLHYFK